MPQHVRHPHLIERDAIAALWHAAWHDAHARLVPAELTQQRTLHSFQPRLDRLWSELRVTGPFGAPNGMCITAQDQLSQMFLAPSARGSGLASTLIADAEQRIARAGHTTAWLACVIDNNRAARFYEKQGWHRVGTSDAALTVAAGAYILTTWRYEKSVCAPLCF